MIQKVSDAFFPTISETYVARTIEKTISCIVMVWVFFFSLAFTTNFSGAKNY